MPTLDELASLARPFGIDHLGVAPASVLERARGALHARRDAGFDGGMGFTYRDPERATDPTRIVDGARSVIVAARSYLVDEDDPRVARPAGVHARVGRYAWTDHYAPLRGALRAMSRRLKASGERATMQCDENGLVDREAAYLAGLGWFGKNANLMLPGAGSWFVLGSVVTTASFEPAAETVRDGCGSCRRCLDHCPTGAIVAPGVIDANRCLAWVLQRPGTIPDELRGAIGDRIYGCDDCQEACPPTVRLGRRHRQDLPADPTVTVTAPGHGGELRAWVDVLDLLDADDETLLARHGRWYIAERNPRWLRRNALVVLGNTGSAADVRTRATLLRYRHHDDEVLAEHARWATAQLGLVADDDAMPARAGGSQR